VASATSCDYPLRRRPIPGILEARPGEGLPSVPNGYPWTVGTRQTTSNDQSWRLPLARAGLVSKGVLYVALGLLAISLAHGGRAPDDVSKSDAVREIAELPTGRWLLLGVVAGLAALTLWHAVLAITGDPARGSAKSDRARYAAWTVLYGLTTSLAVRVLGGAWNLQPPKSSSSNNDGPESTVRILMDLPAGALLVGIIGLSLIAYSVHQIMHDVVDTDFLDRLDLASAGNRTADAVEATGRAGYFSRAVVTFLVGLFFLQAAVESEPEEAGGLAQALYTLSSSTWGPVMLWIVAVGLFSYGLFTLLEARYRAAA
jgi:hypothetical protein